ncbi:MAG TPA: OmpA family protein [Polyangiaceae bacterium]
MSSKIAIPAVVVAIIAAGSGSASAQETSAPYFKQYVPPPRNAVELTVGTGYTQGFGSLYRGVGMPSVMREGIAADLGLGYRIDPRWMIGLAGEYQQFDPQRASAARGVTAGIQAAYHLAPANRLDPWVQLGTGYRWLWEQYDVSGTTVVTQGLQAGRLMLGVDLRTTPEFAIAPVIGADIDVFLAQNGSAVSDARTSTFVFAGLMGRFDVGGEKPPMTAVRDTHAFNLDVGVTERQGQAPGPDVTYVGPSISVSRDIVQACRLMLDNPPEFGFDDSELTAVDRSALDAIAECLMTGPLQGRQIRLVGRADPRGEPQYNFDLGARRAKAVADYLELHGLDPASMELTSRGSLDATGYNEAGWANDRRVDVVLVH